MENLTPEEQKRILALNAAVTFTQGRTDLRANDVVTVAKIFSTYINQG